MGGVFISYSRRDSAFVSALAAELSERGKEPWLDVEGIQDGEVFPAVLREAIERTDGLVFVISPAAAESRFCRQEVEHALALGKRVVPLVHEPVPDEALPPGIRERQWVPAGPDAADRLVRALDADPEHVRRHTALLLRARAWADAGRPGALLPRGEELREAEGWLAGALGRDPAPTELHATWAAAGRRAATRRQRRLTVAAAGAALVAVVLTAVALVSREAAVDAESGAQSRALAARSESQLGLDPQLSILLAREALRAASTPEAMLAATRALDANTLRSTLPSVGPQGCQFGSRLQLLDGGRTGAVTTCDGLLVLQDLRRGAVLARVRIGRSATGLAVSPDGRTIVAGAGDDVVLVDVRSRRVTRRIPVGEPVQDVAFDGDGRRIGVAAATTLGLLDPERGSRMRKLERIAGRPTTWTVVRFAGERLLAGTIGQDDKAGLAAYDLAAGGRKRWLLRTSADGQRRAEVSSIVVARDERTAYVGTVRSTSGAVFRASVARLDLRTGEVRWRHDGPRYSQVGTVALSQDEDVVAAGTGVGVAWTLDAETGAVRTALAGQTVPFRGLAFRGGEAPLVSSTGDGRLRTWAARSTELVLRRLPGGRAGTAEGASVGPKLFHGAGEAHLVIDPATGRTARRIPRIPFEAFPIFAPGEERYWTTPVFDEEGVTMEIRDTASGRRIRSLPLSGSAGALGLAHDGRIADLRTDAAGLVATGVVRAPDGSREVELERFAVRCPVNPFWSLDAKVLGSLDICGGLTFHDPRTGRVIRRVEVDDRPQFLAWMPDGRVATTGARGTVAVVDPRTGSVRTLREHDDAIDDLVSSPDGRWLAAMGVDRRISVWDAGSLRLVRQHVLPVAPIGIDFSADSRRLAAIDRDGFVHVWDVCDVCRDPDALLQRTREASARPLTPSERATFGV